MLEHLVRKRTMLIVLNLVLILNLVALPLAAEDVGKEFEEVAAEVVEEGAEIENSRPELIELEIIDRVKEKKDQISQLVQESKQEAGEKQENADLDADPASASAKARADGRGYRRGSENEVESVDPGSLGNGAGAEQGMDSQPATSTPSYSQELLTDDKVDKPGQATTSSEIEIDGQEQPGKTEDGGKFDNNKLPDGNQLREEICDKLGKQDCTPTEEKTITTPEEYADNSSINSDDNSNGLKEVENADENGLTAKEEGEENEGEAESLGNQGTSLEGGDVGSGDEGTEEMGQEEGGLAAKSGNLGSGTIISDNEGPGDNRADSNLDESTKLVSENETEIDNTQKITANTGQNVLEYGGKGEGGIYTGDAGTRTESDLQANTNDIETPDSPNNPNNPDLGGCTGCFSMWQSSTLSSNSKTGDKSNNQAGSKSNQDISIVNINKLLVNNDFDIFSNSGLNKILSGEKFKNGGIETGNVKAKTNILNLANTNLVDALFKPVLLNIEDYFTGNINLWQFLLSQFGLNKGVSSETIASNASTGDESVNLAEAISKTNFEVNNINNGLIFNDLDIKAYSGKNQILSGYKVKDAYLKTGQVDASTNLFNFLNINLVKAEWVVAVINVFGDWVGDLVLPTVDDFFPAGMQLIDGGAGSASAEIMAGDESAGSSINQALAVVTNDKEITSQNEGWLSSEVVSNANSGKNEMYFTDKAKQVDVTTGKAVSQSNFMSLANKNVIGGGWFSGFFNSFGNWAGQVIGLSDRAAVWGTDKSFVVSDDRPEFSPVPLKGSGEVRAEIVEPGEGSTNIARAESHNSFKVTNENQGVIVNKVKVEADSGSNEVAAVKGIETRIETGDVRAATNISNFLNINLTGSKVVTFALNIFGNWTGNLVFGKEADLAVSMALVNKGVELVPGSEVSFELEVENKDNKNPMAGELSLDWDEELVELVGIESNQGVVASPGISKLPLSEIEPGGKADYTLNFKFKDDLPENKNQLTLLAKVKAQGADSDLTNNQALLELDLGNGDENGSGESQEEDYPLELAGNSADNEDEPAADDKGDQTGGVDNSSNQSSGSDGSNNSYAYAPVPRPSEYLSIIKTNNASGVLKYGDRVDYKVVIKNKSGYTVNELVFYDKFEHLDTRSIIFNNSKPLESIGPYEQIVIDYQVSLDQKFIHNGRYRNTAYVTGVFEHELITFEQSWSDILVDTKSWRPRLIELEDLREEDFELDKKLAEDELVEDEQAEDEIVPLATSTALKLDEPNNLYNPNNSDTTSELVRQNTANTRALEQIDYHISRDLMQLGAGQGVVSVVMGKSDKVFNSLTLNSKNRLADFIAKLQNNWWILSLIVLFLGLTKFLPKFNLRTSTTLFSR